jgi:hypothetical protein
MSRVECISVVNEVDPTVVTCIREAGVIPWFVSKLDDHFVHVWTQRTPAVHSDQCNARLTWKLTCGTQIGCSTCKGASKFDFRGQLNNYLVHVTNNLGRCFS